MLLRPLHYLTLICILFSCQHSPVEQRFNADASLGQMPNPEEWGHGGIILTTDEVYPGIGSMKPTSTHGFQPGEYDRTAIKKNLAEKMKNGEPWIAHVLVPLCDNDNQGIVPVNSSLGNGQNPHTNLYWGAGYGLKTHFQRSADWKSIPLYCPFTDHILRQVAFEKTFPEGNTVIVVMQAYDGAYMKDCLEDYFDFLSGNKQLAVRRKDGGLIKVGQDADLIALNGHNGLMDVDVDIPASKDGIHRDAVAIACISHDYFREPLARAGGYPLVCTTGLMAPEAYVMRAVLDAWGGGKAPADIRTAAGAAYHKYQKCGIKGATNLFRTGW